MNALTACSESGNEPLRSLSSVLAMRVLGITRKSVNEEGFSCDLSNDMCPQAHIYPDHATAHGVAQPAFDLAIREFHVERRLEPRHPAGQPEFMERRRAALTSASQQFLSGALMTCSSRSSTLRRGRPASPMLSSSSATQAVRVVLARETSESSGRTPYPRIRRRWRLASELLRSVPWSALTVRMPSG